MAMISDSLKQMNIFYHTVETIREKDGIGVYRVFRDNAPPVILKTFAKECDRREIENYKIVKSLGVQALEVLAYTKDSILLEDVTASSVIRLGVKEDMDDPVICAALGSWYRALHSTGREYIAGNHNAMYSEADCLTHENMDYVMRRTNTEKLPVWRAVYKIIPKLHELLSHMPVTLTYNDFFYTNLIAAKDKTFAFMFDYNLLGRGIAASDIRNVTWSLGKCGKEAFLTAYGGVDPKEKAIDHVMCVLTTLYSASQRSVFPSWASESLAALENGVLSNAIDRLAEAFPCLYKS